MTITTAERRPPLRVQRVPRLAPLAAAVCGVLLAPASRADWSVRPSFELRESYTDNVALRAVDPQAQWITELSPGLAIEHRGRRLTASVRTRLDYFIYGDERISGTNRFHKQFNGAANAELIEDLLFVEATGSIAPRNISPFGQQATQSRYASANQAEVRTYSISPSLNQRFGNSARMLLRYTHDSVDAGASGFGSSEGNNFLFDLSSGPSFRNLAWSVRASRYDVERFQATRNAGADPAASPLSQQNTVADNALASLRYSVTRTFGLTASAGYDSYDYDSLGGKTEGASWTTGFTWAPSARTSVQASIGRRYVGSNNAFQALHRSRRTTWRLSYDESVNNMRSNFLLPATFDTASLLDRMLTTNIPDPVQRRAEVEALMRERNLPPSLVDNVNFLSNRYFLQKQLTASVGVKLARTDMTLALYRTRSDALSSSESDSVILGRATSSLNDKTRQVGASFTLNYKISPRSNLRLTQNVYDNTSLTPGGRSSTNRALRVGLTRKMSREVNGSLELRRIAGNSVVNNFAPYREHAIAATLSYQR